MAIFPITRYQNGNIRKRDKGNPVWELQLENPEYST